MYNITVSIAQNCTYCKSKRILLSKSLKKSANITHCSHKSTDGFVLLGTVIISLLRQGALQNSQCAALPQAALLVYQLRPIHQLSPFWSLLTAVLHGGRGFHNYLAFPFWLPGALGVRGIQYSTEYGRDTDVFVQHIWQPKTQLRRLPLVQRRWWSLLLWFCAQAARVQRCGGPCHLSILQPASFVETDRAYQLLSATSSWFFFHSSSSSPSFQRLTTAFVHVYRKTS